MPDSAYRKSARRRGSGALERSGESDVGLASVLQVSVGASIVDPPRVEPTHMVWDTGFRVSAASSLPRFTMRSALALVFMLGSANAEADSTPIGGVHPNIVGGAASRHERA